MKITLIIISVIVSAGSGAGAVYAFKKIFYYRRDLLRCIDYIFLTIVFCLAAVLFSVAAFRL